MAEQTTKQKIDKLLGIDEQNTLDDMLDEMSLDVNALSSTMGIVQDQMKESLDEVDIKINALNAASPSGMITLAMNDLMSSMKNVEDLVVLSKQMYKHIYDNICSTDLLDSELISAAAKLLESIHINIKEFIDMYRERQRNVERIQNRAQEQQYRIEMENLRHKHAMELFQVKQESNAVNVPEGLATYTQEDIVKLLDQNDKELEDEQEKAEKADYQ